MKAHTHLLKTIVFSLYHFILRPTKIIKGADKNKAHFLENKVLSKKYVNKWKKHGACDSNMSSIEIMPHDLMYYMCTIAGWP